MTAPDAAPGPEPVARFRRDALAVNAFGDTTIAAEPLALAVSGGADSMAMLVLAHAAFPGRVIAATVDHRLRQAAADEAAMVAAWCAGAGVPHRILTPDTPIGTADVQAQARRARYALLAEWMAGAGATTLMTAHHADDQAETFLMRAVRGAGPAGLSGIRARRPLDGNGAWLVRPLLDWRRAELRDLVLATGTPFVDDPSNDDIAYERVRARALLRENPWLDPERLARSAMHAGEANAAIDGWVAALWDERRLPSTEGTCRIDVTGLPREITRRLARIAIETVRTAMGIIEPAFGSESNIEPLLDLLAAETTATQGGVMVSATAQKWYFRAAPPRRSL